MRDIRVDEQGDLRCWNCGAKQFQEKRTFRAKAMGVAAGVATVGIAAAAPLGTKKKLRCAACGQYNDVGSAKPFSPPAQALRAVAAPIRPAPDRDPALAAMRLRQQELLALQERRRKEADERAAEMRQHAQDEQQRFTVQLFRLQSMGRLTADEVAWAQRMHAAVDRPAGSWFTLEAARQQAQAIYVHSVVHVLERDVDKIEVADWYAKKQEGFERVEAAGEIDGTLDPLLALPRLERLAAAAGINQDEGWLIRSRVTPPTSVSAETAYVPYSARKASEHLDLLCALADERDAGVLRAQWVDVKSNVLRDIAKLDIPSA